MTGNLRVDALTRGLSDDIGDDTGFVVVIARGRYDRDAMLAAIKGATGPDPDDFSLVNVDGQEIISLRFGGLNLILDRGERLILVNGPVPGDENPLEKLPLAAIVRTLKTGQGGLKRNREMARLINSTRPDCELMAVMKVSPAYHEAEFVAAFDTIVLTTTGVTAGTELKLVASIKDAEAATKALTDFNQGRQGLLEDVKEAPPMMKEIIAPLARMIRELKIENDQKTVTLTVTTQSKALIKIVPLMSLWKSTSLFSP